MADGGLGASGSADLAAFDKLADLPRWVGWRPGVRTAKDGTKSPTKKPFDPKPGRRREAKTNDPTTWGTRADAQVWVGAEPLNFGGGIGIVLGDLGDGRFLAGIDFDSCFAPDGALAGWAGKIVNAIAGQTYTEWSPSGTGLKSFFGIAAADVRPFLDAIEVAPNAWGCKRSPAGEDGSGHGPAIEVYTAGRYFTTTGRRWGTASSIANLGPAMDGLATALNAAWGQSSGGAKSANGSGGKSSGKGRDNSASVRAYRAMFSLRRRGFTYAAACAAMRQHSDQGIRDWVAKEFARKHPFPTKLGNDLLMQCAHPS